MNRIVVGVTLVVSCAAPFASTADARTATTVATQATTKSQAALINERLDRIEAALDAQRPQVEATMREMNDILNHLTIPDFPADDNPNLAPLAPLPGPPQPAPLLVVPHQRDVI